MEQWHTEIGYWHGLHLQEGNGKDLEDYDVKFHKANKTSEDMPEPGRK